MSKSGTHRFVQSERSVRRLRNREDWGLKSTKRQGHTVESIAQAAQEIRGRFPTMGARAMVTTLRQDYGIRVPEYGSSYVYHTVVYYQLTSLYL